MEIPVTPMQQGDKAISNPSRKTAPPKRISLGRSLPANPSNEKGNTSRLSSGKIIVHSDPESIDATAENAILDNSKLPDIRGRRKCKKKGEERMNDDFDEDISTSSAFQIQSAKRRIQQKRFCVQSDEDDDDHTSDGEDRSLDVVPILSISTDGLSESDNSEIAAPKKKRVRKITKTSAPLSLPIEDETIDDDDDDDLKLSDMVAVKLGHPMTKKGRKIVKIAALNDLSSTGEIPESASAKRGRKKTIKK